MSTHRTCPHHRRGTTRHRYLDISRRANQTLANQDIPIVLPELQEVKATTPHSAIRMDS